MGSFGVKRDVTVTVIVATHGTAGPLDTSSLLHNVPWAGLIYPEDSYWRDIVTVIFKRESSDDRANNRMQLCCTNTAGRSVCVKRHISVSSIYPKDSRCINCVPLGG